MSELYKKLKIAVRWILATRLRRIIASLLIIIIIIGPLSFLLFNKKTEAAWFDDNWYYRKSIPLTNNTTEESNVYVAVTLDTTDTTKFQADCGDLRFTKYNGELLPYYIASGCGTSSTSVFVAFDTFPAGQQTIYYYYGNSSAPNGFTNASGSGSVTQANMKMSIVNGTAFADFSAAGTLTNNMNSKVVITDSATKKLTGYIKAAGSGETYGSEQLANSSFDNTSNVNSANGASISVVSSNCQSGSCLLVTIAAGQTYGGLDTYLTNALDGAVYRNTVYIKGGTADNSDFHFISSNYAAITTTGWLAVPGSWTQRILYGTNAQVGGTQYQWPKHTSYIHSDTGETAYFDTPSSKQVLTPSATGVTITSTANGGTYNWASEESGFNRNDSSNYTYIIYPQAFSTAASNYTVGLLGSEEMSTAPVAYWSFDEGYGAVAHDETSNRNNGTITSATWKPESECVSGKCLAFDGSGDFVSTPIGNNRNVSTDPISVSMWVRPSTSKNEIFFSAANGTNQRLYISIYGDKWDMGIQSQTQGGGSVTSATYNQWHHIYLVMDGSVAKLYVDGKYSFQKSYTSYALAGNYYIGKHATDNQFDFLGSLDEPKIYPYARTAAQIRQDYNAGLAGMGKAKEGSSVSIGGKSNKWLTDGLVGHWKMDESSGTAVADASGNGNTGTLTNAQEAGTSDASGNSVTTMVDTDGTLSTTDDAYNGMILRFTAACGSITSGTERLISDYTGASKTFTVATLASVPNSCAYEVRHQTGGKFGNGMAFSGRNGYVNSGHSTSLDVANTETISFWIKGNAAQLNSYGPIMHKKDTYGWTATVNETGPNIYMRVDTSGGANQSSGNISALDGTWHHIVWTLDNGTRKGYKDGVLIVNNTYNHGSGFSTSAEDLIINNIYSDGFNGSMDDVRIYNRTLSPGEVEKLYEWAPGPVGEWKMDEKVSGDAKTLNDSSGNGNNGTTVDGANNTGMDCSKPGKYGSACQFDGSDDHIQTPITSISPAFTASAWVYANDVGSSHTVISKMDDSPSDHGFFLRISGGYMGASVVDSGTSSGVYGAVDTGTWHHWSMTYDGTTVKLYKDGVSVNAFSDTGVGTMQTNPNHIYIGDNYGDGVGSQFFNGIIDNAKFYSYARTQKQILEDMNPSTDSGQAGLQDPVAYYKFDEGYGDTAHNSGIGTSIDGTLNSGGSGGNSTTTAMWDNGGKVGKAIEFDGSNDYVGMGDVIDMGTNDFSISAWVKSASTDAVNGNGIVYKKTTGSSTQAGYRLNMPNGQFNFLIADGTNYKQLTVGNSGQYNDGNWHSVVATAQRGRKMTIYVDGRYISETSETTVGNIDSATSFAIGALYMPTVYHPFSGSIDEVKIYNYALTDDDVKSDYNQGSSTVLGSTGTNSSGAPDSSTSREYCVPGDTTSCAGPVGEWKMDEKTGTTAYDTSGNDNYGTLGDGTADWRPTWTRGKFGSALSFDGTNDCVPAGSPAIFDNMSTLTWSAWIYPKSLSGNEFAFITKGAMGAPNYYAKQFMVGDLFGRSDVLQVGFSTVGGGDGYAMSVNNSIQLNTWQYVTATWGGIGTAPKLYINGNEVSYYTQTTAVGTIADDSAMRLYIGSRDSTGNCSDIPFNGLIDDVQIFNYARTPAQIAWDYNKGKSVAEWRFDECQGGTIHDESGNGNNGTITLGASGQTANGTCTENANTPWYNGRTGQKNASLNFDGTDDYVSAQDSASLDITGDITITGWIYPKDSSSNDRIVTKMISGNSDGYDIMTWGGKMNPMINTWDRVGNLVYSANEWAHFVFVKSGTNVTLYKDGIFDASWSDAPATINTNNAALIIGGAFGYIFNGILDEVKIFNYALTPLQVKNLFNNNSAIYFGD